MSDETRWHELSAQEAMRALDVSAASGLTDQQAAERLARHGPNRPTAAPGRAAWRRLLDQVRQPLVLVLVASGIVAAALGAWVDAAVILGVVIVNAAIGYLQEGKAEAALAALARAIATEATVVRDGRRRRVDAVELVPGDVVILTAGDKVPADLRLLHAKELRTSEAALTGESLPADKRSGSLPADTALADRHNMAYAGTFVVAGQGQGTVVATGDATETGRIARLIAAAPDLSTPLTRKMAAFSRQLLIAILVLAAGTFAIGIWRGESVIDMFMAAVALAVGAIPEGLPAAITITLAIGVGRMARRRAVIRRLPAVEALGSTTVICSDKTGTLTENRMSVREILAGGNRYQVSGDHHRGAIELAGQPAAVESALREVLVAGVLCNDASIHHDGHRLQLTGDPTEAALLVAAGKAGLDEATLRRLLPRLDELPFDSARQAMATLHAIEGEQVLYVKGAIEKILPACVDSLDGAGRSAPLTAAAIVTEAAAMAHHGQRVLALARRRGVAVGIGPESAGAGLTFLGLVGMADPPRAKAIAAVRTCHAAGIRVKMITGDHAETALAVAREVGISDEAGRALTGRELARLDDAALRRAVAGIDVFARVEPAQKLRLVEALQAEGEVVAMTGDGVNDAPALKRADIGIAMGQGGTEVAKEAAAMVLTDDDFATIEAAVEEGRAIYDNIVKFITWTLPTNFAEGLVIVAAILVGATLPITPLQILWINMTTAVLLGLPLAFEPRERDIMHRPPRPPAAPVLDATLLWRIALVGTLTLAGAFGLFQLALAQGRDLAEARTVAANVFVMTETFYLFNCRSLVQPVRRLGWFSNRWVWFGAGATLFLQALFTYLPALQEVFGSAAIGAADWLQIVVFGAFSAVVVGAEKRWRLHRRRP